MLEHVNKSGGGKGRSGVKIPGGGIILIKGR